MWRPVSSTPPAPRRRSPQVARTSSTSPTPTTERDCARGGGGLGHRLRVDDLTASSSAPRTEPSRRTTRTRRPTPPEDPRDPRGHQRPLGAADRQLDAALIDQAVAATRSKSRAVWRSSRDSPRRPGPLRVRSRAGERRPPRGDERGPARRSRKTARWRSSTRSTSAASRPPRCSRARTSCSPTTSRSSDGTICERGAYRRPFSFVKRLASPRPRAKERHGLHHQFLLRLRRHGRRVRPRPRRLLAHAPALDHLGSAVARVGTRARGACVGCREERSPRCEF